MSTVRRRTPGPARDRGSVLPLVLVMIVVAGLIVVPMLSYAVSIFRANSVVSTRTRDLESAKGGLRVALADPANIFTTCDNSGSLPATTVNGLTVTTTCTELAEIGPATALGYQLPTSAVATQLGATVPSSFSGTRGEPPAVPPYVAPDWWAGQTSDIAPVNDAIWMPQLPRYPSSDRVATPFNMPSSFDAGSIRCKVFLPGRYSSPLTLDQNWNYYFASGVYYFSQPIRVSGAANVVVGYGLSDFDNTDCADDIQVAANVQSPPATFDINGGGATFVFGANAQLVIDDSNGSAAGPRVRFNQRYAGSDQGSRISIMTVNGATTTTDHVGKVNHTPVSKIVTATTADDGSLTYSTTPIPASNSYAVSSITYTDAARPPLAPAAPTVTWVRTASSGATSGAALVSWDESIGQATGGAPLDVAQPYQVSVVSASLPTRTCEPGTSTYVAPATPGNPGRISCLVTGLAFGSSYTVTVAARNEEVGSLGTSSASTIGRPRSSAGGGEPASPVLAPPAAPTDVTVTSSDGPDEAMVSWTASASASAAPLAPVTRYEVTAYRVSLEAPAVVDDPSTVVEQEVGACVDVPSPLVATELRCEITGLSPLTAGDGVTGDIGYRFTVTATNWMGSSSAGATGVPPYTDGLPLSFAGDGAGPTVPTERIVEPWIPTPIIDVNAGAGTEVSIPGYVAAPMGRIDVTGVSPTARSAVKINGGVLAGTYSVDAWMRTDPADTVPIGFTNDVVLQRKVQIVSRAGNATSTAIVQINEDGADYAVNAWAIS